MVEEQKLFKPPEEKKREEKPVEEKPSAGIEEKKKQAEIADLRGGEKKEEKEEEEKPAPAPKKEEKKEAKKEEKPKREIILQRVYSVPLAKAYSKPRMHRADSATRFLREFAARHMKVPLEKVRIDARVNSAVRKRGSRKPAKKIRVLASKDKAGIVLVEPA